MKIPERTESELVDGALYVVSTPIGNLADISLRALRILEDVDLIAAEDTRTTGNLLRHYGISTPRISLFSANENARIPLILDKLRNGSSVAVVSDAGTPGISDPAARLVSAVVSVNIPVFPIPGASAVLAALVVSGLPTDRFYFQGFLPLKKRRKSTLEELAEMTRTIVLYESVHRLHRTLRELHGVFGDRNVSVCRELTKKFEETIRGTLSEVCSHFEQKAPRGEFVIVIDGKR